MGVAAVIARREEFVATLMARPTWTTLSGRTRIQPPAVYLNPVNILSVDLNSVMPPAQGKRKHAMNMQVIADPHGRLLWPRRPCRAPTVENRTRRVGMRPVPTAALPQVTVQATSRRTGWPNIRID